MKGKKDELTPTQILMQLYPRKCKQANFPIYKQFYDNLKKKAEEEEELEQLHLWDPSNPNAVKIMFECIRDAKIANLVSVRLWKVGVEDEGSRAIAEYLKANTTVKILDLLDNNISPLGCDFLGKMLHPAFNKTITKLYLDHNVFGSAGLSQLASGLASNGTLEEISLSFCGIDVTGVKYLQQILAFINTMLKKINLQGNPLGNEGILMIFKSLEANKVLNDINVSDTQFGGEGHKETMDQIVSVMGKSQNIYFYDFKYNGIYNDDAVRILQACKDNTKICRVDFSDRFDKATAEAFRSTLAKRKPPKPKKTKKQ